MTGGCLFKLGGQEHWLVYTADAYFELRDKYGAELLSQLRADTHEAYEIAVGCFAVLAREGELCRRYMGYEAQPMLPPEDIRRVILPDGVTKIKTAVGEAILAGMRIENGKRNNEPVDIGLAEFEKKTTMG